MAIITKNVFVYIKTFPKTATYGIMYVFVKSLSGRSTYEKEK